MGDVLTVLDNAVEDHKVPFVVAMTANAEGVTFSGASGDAAAGRAAAEETVFRVFSMTKAVGSVAAMILIDRGKLSMETPVGDILPEWNNLQVLDGFNDAGPILRTQQSSKSDNSNFNNSHQSSGNNVSSH